MSIEQWSELMFPEQRGADAHAYGRVVSINADGSYEVQLNRSAVTTKCAPCCSALVGDRVLVVIKANGKCDAIGRLGGEIGGGGTVVTKVDDVSNYIAGRVFAHAGTNDPAGALLCDGRAVSRTTYWELFAAIGTTYGAGDGSSTFNLPNIESRTIIGEGTGASGTEYALGATGGEEKHLLTVDEMPNHDHFHFLDVNGYVTSDTNMNMISSAGYKWGTSGSKYTPMDTSNTGGDQPHNNMQPYIVMRYFITTGKGDPASGINPADYVVEWGETDGWRWEKYASGKAECWAHVSHRITGFGAWGGGYVSNEATTPVAYPFEFAEAPTEVVNISDAGSQGVVFIGKERDKANTATSCGSYLFYRGTNMGAATVNLSFHVKGTWKDSPASGGTETIAPTIENRFQGIEADIDLLKTNKVLWSGGHYMNADHTATLSEPVSAQPRGIVLVWSWYGDGRAHDSNFRHFFIPKHHVLAHNGCGVDCAQIAYDANMAKYVYVKDTEIVGHTLNMETNNTGGCTFVNTNFVLRQVLGV